MDNKITRESMNMIIEEIMGVMTSDWITDDSKPAEIERIIVDNGLATVIENENFNRRELDLILEMRNNMCLATMNWRWIYGMTDGMRVNTTETNQEYYKTIRMSR